MKLGLVLLLAIFVPAVNASQNQLTITAVNKLKIARPSETIELTAEVLAPLSEKDLTKLHVRDASGKDVLAQAVDTDYDDYHEPDVLIFQTDFAPNETRTFTITAGKKREYRKEDFRAYGRFVRERFDDFTWDAGSQLNHFRAFYQAPNGGESLALAVGLKKIKDAQKQFDAERGWLTIWEPMTGNHGMQGLAIVVAPRAVDKLTEDKLNHLLVLKPGITAPVSYWAGFAWDRAGKIPSAESWNAYVDQFAERLRSPIEVSQK